MPETFRAHSVLEATDINSGIISHFPTPARHLEAPPTFVPTSMDLARHFVDVCVQIDEVKDFGPEREKRARFHQWRKEKRDELDMLCDHVPGTPSFRRALGRELDRHMRGETASSFDSLAVRMGIHIDESKPGIFTKEGALAAEVTQLNVFMRSDIIKAIRERKLDLAQQLHAQRETWIGEAVSHYDLPDRSPFITIHPHEFEPTPFYRNDIGSWNR